MRIETFRTVFLNAALAAALFLSAEPLGAQDPATPRQETPGLTDGLYPEVDSAYADDQAALKERNEAEDAYRANPTEENRQRAVSARNDLRRKRALLIFRCGQFRVVKKDGSRLRITCNNRLEVFVTEGFWEKMTVRSNGEVVSYGTVYGTLERESSEPKPPPTWMTDPSLPVPGARKDAPPAAAGPQRKPTPFQPSTPPEPPDSSKPTDGIGTREPPRPQDAPAPAADPVAAARQELDLAKQEFQKADKDLNQAKADRALGTITEAQYQAAKEKRQAAKKKVSAAEEAYKAAIRGIGKGTGGRGGLRKQPITPREEAGEPPAGIKPAVPPAPVPSSEPDVPGLTDPPSPPRPGDTAGENPPGTSPASPPAGAPDPPGEDRADCVREGMTANVMTTVVTHGDNHDHSFCPNFQNRLLRMNFGEVAGNVFTVRFEEQQDVAFRCSTMCRVCSGSCDATAPNLAGHQNVKVEIQDLRFADRTVEGKLVFRFPGGPFVVRLAGAVQGP